MRRLLVVLIAACTLVASTVDAAPIVWNLAGTITTEIDSPGAASLHAKGVTLATTISFTLTLPESATDGCPDDGEALFSGGSVVTTLLGQSHAGGTVAGIEANASSAGCFATPSNASTFYVLRLNTPGAPFSSATIEWTAPVDPDIYPFPAPSSVQFGLHYFCNVCQADMGGSLRTVPEPATLGLLGLGALASARHRIVWRRREKRRQKVAPR